MHRAYMCHVPCTVYFTYNPNMPTCLHNIIMYMPACLHNIIMYMYMPTLCTCLHCNSAHVGAQSTTSTSAHHCSTCTSTCRHSTLYRCRPGAATMYHCTWEVLVHDCACDTVQCTLHLSRKVGKAKPSIHHCHQ